MKAVYFSSVFVFFLVAAFLVGLTHPHDASGAKKTSFTKHFKESLFQISERGEFSVEVLPDDREYGKLGKNVIGIVIHDKGDEDVEGADLKFILLDEQGRDVTGSLVVKEKGDGLYTVANLNLPKEGKGELKVRIRKKAVEDTAVFAFPDAMKERFPAGRYTQ